MLHGSGGQLVSAKKKKKLEKSFTMAFHSLRLEAAGPVQVTNKAHASLT